MSQLVAPNTSAFPTATGARPDLEGLVSAGGQQPVAIRIPQSLHHRVAVAMQRGNVAPSLGIPHLHQAILAATG